MNYFRFSAFIFLLFTSCNSSQKELSTSLQCENNAKHNTTKLRSDFRKNFTINVPKHWKTQLYYDSQTSEIFIADTTKQLSETFILSSSFVTNKLTIDSSFVKAHNKKMQQENLQFVKGKILSYLNKPAYWTVFKGTKKDRIFHQFSFFIKLSNNTYFTANTDVYGNKNVEERICKSVSIIEQITFN